MTSFCKNENCPSSLELLQFQTGDLKQWERGDIGDHLAFCDFCSAELEFYSHYPQEEGTPDSSGRTEIPAPLFELAEALLKQRNTDRSSLESLLRERGGLVLDTVQ